jgi:hypothetical protein
MDAQQRLARREAILQARAASPDAAALAGAEILRASTTSPQPWTSARILASPRPFQTWAMPESKPAFPLNDDRPAFPLNDDEGASTPISLLSAAMEMHNPFTIAPKNIVADELEHLQSTKESEPCEADSRTDSPRPQIASPGPTRPLSPECYAYLPRTLTPGTEGQREGLDADAALRASVEAELRRKQERAKRKAKGFSGGARDMLLQLEDADAREREAQLARERLRAQSTSPDLAAQNALLLTRAISGSPALRTATPPVRSDSPLVRGQPAGAPLVRQNSTRSSTSNTASYRPSSPGKTSSTANGSTAHKSTSSVDLTRGQSPALNTVNSRGATVPAARPTSPATVESGSKGPSGLKGLLLRRKSLKEK